MSPPAQQKCVKRDCDWQTPLNCPTWDQIKHFMDLHVQAEHAHSAHNYCQRWQQGSIAAPPDFDRGHQ